MKKNQHREQEDRGTEILKAVAQAWHSRSGSSRAASETSEYDTLRRRSTGTPSRFRIEAMRGKSEEGNGNGKKGWDFRQSLWDSYEILSVSRKLETGLAMEDPFAEAGRAGRRRRESSRSLRCLFNRMSSRRFSEEEDQ